MTREDVQRRATAEIMMNGYSGLLDISPRVGKSKILLDSIKGMKGSSITIMAPYQSIVDSWKDEIDRWAPGIDVRLLCTKSASKLDKSIDLLVIDEIQTLSDKQIRDITKAKPYNIVGLTGTISSDTEEKLEEELGIRRIFTYSIDDAIRDGIIANFEVVIVECKLDNQRFNIESGTKKNSFYRSEQGHYNYLTTQYEKFRKLSYRDRSFERLKDMYISRRRDFIYTSNSKLQVAKRIVSTGERSLIFTGRVEQAEYLSLHTYHTKNRKEDNLSKFINGDINQVSVINMVNMGITIPDLKRGVVHQLQSNSEMSLQKILRMCNLEGDKLARIYITVYKDTVDEDWVKKALSGVDKSRIRVIDESAV
jgi:superfamily II DNA or RNA helicase